MVAINAKASMEWKGILSLQQQSPFYLHAKSNLYKNKKEFLNGFKMLARILMNIASIPKTFTCGN